MEGAIEDWEKIARLVPSVADYGLGWWLLHLTVVTDQFLKAAQRHPDRSFWNDFYKASNASGGPYVNGHIHKLFPYVLDDSRLLCQNKFLASDGGKSPFDGCQTTRFPSGHWIAPMRWKYENRVFGMKLISGFSGFSQDDSLAIRPEIGWVISETPSMLDEDASLQPEDQGSHIPRL